MVVGNQHASSQASVCAATGQQGSSALKRLARHMDGGGERVGVAAQSRSTRAAPVLASIRSTASAASRDALEAEWQAHQHRLEARPVMANATEEGNGEEEEEEEEWSEAWGNEAMTCAFLSSYPVPSGDSMEWGESSDDSGGHASSAFHGAWSAAMHKQQKQEEEEGSKFACANAASWTDEFQHGEQRRRSCSVMNTMATELSEAAHAVMDIRAGIATRQWEWRWEKFLGAPRPPNDPAEAVADTMVQQSRRRLEQLLAQFKDTPP
ncbi:hypothetical protein SYNPS1DRAFT_29791 [Syncephalis pseudoplumigaleata]|uniref:Uncharacterized protein n=1 Tax=Syncephalis pseudoplumigaleata TaxID=1712513 RepID=A0A4P9YYL7_9FUNG|nr:hypothetical protein SYNPS1DRAFT_29791 [Syncephalis pseudoplumigaleata]|eukprot:RKP24451.1 hypothetical protein SYNPS1DRAFT_29791 [Syncephalis pseudoplumigaleata]